MQTKQRYVGVGVLIATLIGLAVAPAFAQTDDYGTTAGTYCPQLFQTVVRGSSGNQVLELQKFLSDYYDIPPATIQTGYFGRITQGYVIQFQKEQGLPSYGIAGSMTRAAIVRVCGTKAPVVISPQPASPGGFDANALACGIPRCSDTASCAASLQTVSRSAIDAGSADLVHAGACIGRTPCQIGRDEVSGKLRYFDEGESTKCISQMDGELCISDARYVCRAGAWKIEGGVPKTENKCKTFVNACNICSRSGVGEVMTCKSVGSASPCYDGLPRCIEYFGSTDYTAPTLSFTASSPMPIFGQPFTLNWFSTNTDSCLYSNNYGESNSIATSGSDTKISNGGTIVHTITCKGPGGSVTKSVTTNKLGY